MKKPLLVTFSLAALLLGSESGGGGIAQAQDSHADSRHEDSDVDRDGVPSESDRCPIDPARVDFDGDGCDDGDLVAELLKRLLESDASVDHIDREPTDGGGGGPSLPPTHIGVARVAPYGGVFPPAGGAVSTPPDGVWIFVPNEPDEQRYRRVRILLYSHEATRVTIPAGTGLVGDDPAEQPLTTVEPVDARVEAGLSWMTVDTVCAGSFASRGLASAVPEAGRRMALTTRHTPIAALLDDQFTLAIVAHELGLTPAQTVQELWWIAEALTSPGATDEERISAATNLRAVWAPLSEKSRSTLQRALRDLGA